MRPHRGDDYRASCAAPPEQALRNRQHLCAAYTNSPVGGYDSRRKFYPDLGGSLRSQRERTDLSTLMLVRKERVVVGSNSGAVIDFRGSFAVPRWIRGLRPIAIGPASEGREGLRQAQQGCCSRCQEPQGCGAHVAGCRVVHRPKVRHFMSPTGSYPHAYHQAATTPRRDRTAGVANTGSLGLAVASAGRGGG
jgi:hypothetical protein